MKKLLVFLTVLFAFGALAQAQSSRDVLAHSSGEWAWYAHVTQAPSPDPNQTPVNPPEQTLLFVRHDGPGEQWHSMPTLSGRVLALASRSSQLVVLMNDNQWFTLWGDGSATGQKLPAGGLMKTIADDGEDLWAIGAVNGGLGAANRAILADLASTEPTTSISVISPSAPPAAASPVKLVLFKQVSGRWATVAEFPDDGSPSLEDELSLAVSGGVPMVSFKAADGVHTLRYTVENSWQSAAAIKPAATQPISTFNVINEGGKPILWIAEGNSAGELYPDGLTGNPASVQLKWPGAPLDGTPTATFAGGYVCVFGPHADKVFEQRYKTDGVPFATPAELTVIETDEGLIPHWLQAVLLAFMGFSVGARVFRQWLADDPTEEIESPAPAPLLNRFAAGLIDAVPVIAAVVIVAMQANALHGSGDLPPVKTLIIIGIGLAIYLLHTTLVELFTGRSAGKWLLGLKVVTVEGKTPTQAQFLMRNLLRIVDPLVMILFSPLRQRDADAVANTMVVRTSTKAVENSADGMTGPGADKTE